MNVKEKFYDQAAAIFQCSGGLITVEWKRHLGGGGGSTELDVLSDISANVEDGYCVDVVAQIGPF